jgi:hypothetical protein
LAFSRSFLAWAAEGCTELRFVGEITAEKLLPKLHPNHADVAFVLPLAVCTAKDQNFCYSALGASMTLTLGRG